MPIAISRCLAAGLLAAALPTLAQHHHQGASPYAGQQSRDIKALSDQEVRDLRQGAGMGFAKAAELNRYPGPMHALEHARELALTAAQEEQLARLLQRHKAEARRLGEQIVAIERELDALFANRGATPEAVDRIVAGWGAASAKLRAEHLKTHLETTALLSAEQVERYVHARGY